MLRSLIADIVILSCFAQASWAQSPPATPPAAQPAKSVAKKPTAKATTAAKQPGATESGPCRLGVISAIGDRFSVQKFGVTIFENEATEVPVEGWGFDDFVIARVRAATRADPAVRRIAYPKRAFEPFYNPKSRLFPDPSERLPAIVRRITPNANCARYLVVTKLNGELPGTRMILNGIGTYNQGLGSLVRHSHLFANISLSLLDGRSYEQISRPFANFGTRMSESLRLTEDPLTKLDNSLYPEPAMAASNSPTLRERTRALVAARLDQALPGYLKDE
ncbi:MAG: hypothetical protein HY852_12435 [Bradyrhizobium sp.]|uniref:hypothetical protein n=1 Tax=Bradyrhizobium sp. TaxID=376 RepID=UPI0025C6DD3E|nr:hypothetical protein [Bradyrhizobium sp.]MBI5262611.1 hypothetical protein [Bradyrhizobium sp.]